MSSFFRQFNKQRKEIEISREKIKKEIINREDLFKERKEKMKKWDEEFKRSQNK